MDIAIKYRIICSGDFGKVIKQRSDEDGEKENSPSC
jgi:hypothetical protein